MRNEIKHIAQSSYRYEYHIVFATPLRSVYKELHADRETGC